MLEYAGQFTKELTMLSSETLDEFCNAKSDRVPASALLGKTIQVTDDSSTNCLNFICSDGSRFIIESFGLELMLYKLR